MSVVLGHSGCGNGLQQPKETNTERPHCYWSQPHSGETLVSSGHSRCLFSPLPDGFIVLLKILRWLPRTQLVKSKHVSMPPEALHDLAPVPCPAASPRTPRLPDSQKLPQCQQQSELLPTCYCVNCHYRSRLQPAVHIAVTSIPPPQSLPHPHSIYANNVF